MYCEKCGQALIDGFEYCMRCGTKINQVEAAPEDTIANRKRLKKRLLFIVIPIVTLILAAGIWFGTPLLSGESYDYPRGVKWGMTPDKVIAIEKAEQAGEYEENKLYFKGKETELAGYTARECFVTYNFDKSNKLTGVSIIYFFEDDTGIYKKALKEITNQYSKKYGGGTSIMGIEETYYTKYSKVTITDFIIDTVLVAYEQITE